MHANAYVAYIDVYCFWKDTQESSHTGCLQKRELLERNIWLPLVPFELEGSMAELVPSSSCLRSCIPCLRWSGYVTPTSASGHIAFSARCVKHPSACLLYGHLWSHVGPIGVISPSQKP